MFLLTFTAKPKPGTRKAKSFGGAYVNCWVNFSEADGAKILAKYYIEKAGWIAGRKTAESWYEKEDYLAPDQLEYYLNAEEIGICLVFHSWPINAKN